VEKDTSIAFLSKSHMSEHLGYTKELWYLFPGIAE